LDDPDVRAGWRRLEGDISPVFTSSTRSDFWPPSTHFIGTAESAQRPGSPNDAQTGVIESPAFTLTASRHIFCVSGGSDRENTYVALVDAESGEQLLRLAGTNSNRFEALPVDLSKYTGRQVRIRIVDRAKGSWGHINFGGLFAE
jgi:levanase